MRTTEAARYARWSATVAAMLAVMVVCVYGWRAWEAKQAQSTAPPPVPAAIQQRSAEFSFSKVDGPDTRFILRASHTTEFKEGGRTLLEDVWITSFGGSGKRSDQLHTAICEYFAQSAIVTCPEQVIIDLQDATPEASSLQQDGAPAQSSAVHIVTSRLSFNRETEMATSDEPVQFRFARGEGRAVGLNYDSKRGELHLLRDVELVFRAAAKGESGAAAPATDDDPISIRSGDLVYQREERVIHLNGAATLRHGRQELRAGQMTLELDDDMRTRQLVARDHPILHNPNGDSDVSLAADELSAPLEPSGQPERVIASGNVILNVLRADGQHRLTAASSTLDLIPDSQQPRHFAATGNVVVQSNLQGGSMRHLQTSRLEVYFISASKDDSRVDRATAAPATIDWDNAGGSSSPNTATMRLQGRLLDGSFDESGELRELRGTGGVEVQRRTAGDPPVTSTSRELLAQVASDGQWSTVEQSGEVRLKNTTGDARGDRAHFDRASDSVTLTGSVVLTDASSQTRARVATFRQSIGELRAEGEVFTTELSPTRGSASGAPEFQPTHISSARMVGDTAKGRAVYSGKARMWQGDSILQADTIDLDRLKRTLVATGNVSAVFPQASQNQGRSQTQSSAAKPPTGSPQPRILRAEAGRMIYEEDQHRARLEQGARTRSADGSMRADRMDLFFAPKPGSGAAVTPKPGSAASATNSGLGSALNSQELQRAQGFGAVQVESAGRTGTGERADYSAAEGQFVLSGGRPKLIDEFGNSTAGRQLTFYFADDRIVVDSEEGSQSRTLTLHRVEK